MQDEGQQGEAPPPVSGLTTRWTRLGALHGHDAEQAWHWFVDRYRPFVRGILGGMLGNGAKTAAAEEEFWGYVWLSGALRRADRERRFRAFLSGIVRHFARGFSRQNGLSLHDDWALETAPARDAAAAELRFWVDNVIANAMDTLRAESPTTAMAMTAFYGLDGGTGSGNGRAMSAIEVAAAVDNTPQGIYMLLFRGRKRLRTLIAEELREGCRDDEAFAEELQALLGLAASRLPGLLGDA